MTCVKIISNPYTRELRFQKRNGNGGVWENLSSEECGAPAGGFFAFSAERILRGLTNAFREGDTPLELVFEGTGDEAEELEQLCASLFPEEVRVSRSDTVLENARDILPEIIGVFDRVRRLISDTVRDVEQLDRKLEQFLDASNEIIPICVIGNYSSGKSSFINALIGREILPNGDEPVTAKIYRMLPSQEEETARLEFDYEGERVRMRFEGADYRFLSGLSDKPLICRLNDALIGLENGAVTARVRTALAILNDFDRTEGGERISDLIELELPFEGELWTGGGAGFLILDTPGSNTASNEKHFRVLRKAMEGFSNGIPVYVSEFTALDSVDNDNLYRELRGIEELDPRFTMIVVNKADSARLPKPEHAREKDAEILGQTVPRHLYAMGLFYVSSVMGLGAKTGGAFFDEHYAEVYEDQRQKYENPESTFYRRLYIYDILPEQLRQEVALASEAYENRIYANSGLYAVEQVIRTFAERYAAYNKCGQSELFLRKGIELTSKEIERLRASREAARKNRQEAMERDEAELVEKLRTTAQETLELLRRNYPAALRETLDAFTESDSLWDFSKTGAALLRKHQEALDYSVLEAEAKVARQTVFGNFAENLRKLFRSRSLEDLALLGESLAGDTQKAREAGEARRMGLREAERAAAEELLARVAGEYERNIRDVRESLEAQSLAYWEAHAGEIREALLQVVSGAATLTDEARERISGAIVSYREIPGEDEGEKAKTPFAREEFEYGPLTRLLRGVSEGLNTEKLRVAYQRRLQESVRRIYEAVQKSREESVRRWMEDLLTAIVEHLVEFNPALRNQSELIDEETARIQELEGRQKQLGEYAEEIHQLMDWKEA